MEKTLKAFSLLGLAASLTWGAEAKVERKPLNIGGAAEFGSIAKGVYDASIGSKGAEEKQGEWVDHFLAWFNHQVVVEDRLHLSAGLGGVFQFRKPEIPGTTFSSHQRKAFFIGPSTTEAVYHFGELEKPWLKLGVGLFPYKYNPEAVNLGEYLFRSAAYPTFVRTGGYLVVNSAAAQLQGFKALFQSGNIKADVLLFTETTLAPLYNWSLAGVLEYSVAGGFLNLGAGVNLQHLLSVKPSRTALARAYNSHFERDGKEYVGNAEFYSSRAGFYKDRAAEALAAGGDSAEFVRLRDSLHLIAELVGKKNSQNISDIDGNPILDGSGNPVFGWKDSVTEIVPGAKFYSSAGVLLMGRATLDVKKAFGGAGVFGPEDLKLYGEVNVLGVQNHPVYYKKITERMPVMVGFNLPGFKFLDLIALQAEYFNSPWMNNTFMRGNTQGGNIPFVPTGSDRVISENDYNDGATKDNFKWSVLVKKSLGNAALTVQVASDHLNLTSSSYYYGPQFDPGEITAFKDHWYWMTQLSWGI